MPQRLLDDASATRVFLLNPEKKVAYDEMLRKLLSASKRAASMIVGAVVPVAIALGLMLWGFSGSVDASGDARPEAVEQVKMLSSPDNPEESRHEAIQPPTAEVQKPLIAAVDELYGASRAKDPGAQIALARRLIQEGRKDEGNRAEQFVLFRRASEIARDAGDVEVMLEAVEAMVEAGFRMQPLVLKSRLLKQLAEQGVSGGPRVSAFGGACVAFAEEAATGGNVEAGLGVLDAALESVAESKRKAQQTATTARTSLLRAHTPMDRAERETKVKEADEELAAVVSAQSALTNCVKSLRQTQKEREAIRAAQERLKAAPDDPEACLLVGQWQCFDRDDWESGLRLLAKGSDAGLRLLAGQELSSPPTTAEDKVNRGDAWWDLAEKSSGKSRSALRGRGTHWYEAALKELPTGLVKSRVEKRVAEAAKTPSPEVAGPNRPAPSLAVAPFNEKSAKQHQARWAKYLEAPIVLTNSIGMKFAIIPPGEFEMGSTKELLAEESRVHEGDGLYRDHLSAESPRHHVRISSPYWLGVTEVTQEEYERVLGTTPSKFLGEPRQPVEQVSWDDAVKFCNRLSELPGEKVAKREYQLPSEAQWEYACRAGQSGRWCFGDPSLSMPLAVEENVASACGWFQANAGGRTHPVGQKGPNAFGLYDTIGNVWEWCSDWYDPEFYRRSPENDPAGPASGVRRACRGGGWKYAAGFCRSAFRFCISPGERYDDIGFRICLVIAENTGQRSRQLTPSAVAPEPVKTRDSRVQPGATTGTRK